MRDLFLILLFLVLWVLFVPAPEHGIDCSHYHEKTFHGVVVNCDQAVLK